MGLGEATKAGSFYLLDYIYIHIYICEELTGRQGLG